MPTYPSGHLLTRARQLSNKLLPDTATIARTGAVLPCRVSRDTQGTSPAASPAFFRTLRTVLTFADGVDVLAGDSVTVTGKGTFSVLVVAPVAISYSVATTAYVLLTQRADGTPTLYTNQSVTLRDPRATARTMTVRLAIYSTAYEPSLLEYAASYPYTAVWDASLHYSDTTAVSTNHQIVWDRLKAPGFATLRYVREAFDPPPRMVGLFGEKD